MKPVLTVPTLHAARWIELPDAIVVSAAWIAEQGGITTTRFAQHPIVDPEGPPEASHDRTSPTAAPTDYRRDPDAD